MERKTKTLAVASVLLQRHDSVASGVSSTTTTMTQHYREGVSNIEMTGIAFQESIKLKPGFAVVEILVSNIEIALQ